MRAGRSRIAGRVLWLLGLVFAAVFFLGGTRVLRAWNVANGLQSQIRSLIQSGGTIGESQAGAVLSEMFLATVFGDDPQLLSRIQSVIAQGLVEAPALSLGEVACLLVTYHQTQGGQVKDVAVHIMGGFPITRRKPQMHQGGYFYQLIERDLWTLGNSMVGFLGREMMLFTDPEYTETHRKILEAALTGNIMPLVQSLRHPLHYVAIFPEPYRVTPPALRDHVRTAILRGHLARYDGATELLLLCRSPASARYTLAVLRDLRTVAEVALRTKWKGIRRQTPWGPVVDPWWAFEMAETIHDLVSERERNVIRMRAQYDRVMVNVVLKVIERAGRDLAHIRGTEQERLDPRVVDARLQTRKPLHYWSEEHRWGPNWPIPPPETNRPASIPSSPPESGPGDTGVSAE
ncbi:MAG TPA: hypothetical protein EYP62_06120 [Kiritimatiellae bacterium]|nr:hypothetical protein [Kiritimatiellia bacterium]